MAIFTEQPHWQSWLLAFLARPAEPALASSLQSAVVRVATHAVYHLLMSADGWKGINELHAMVSHFAEFFDTAPFLRALCSMLLTDLQRDNRILTALHRDLRVWENFVAFLSITEVRYRFTLIYGI